MYVWGVSAAICVRKIMHAFRKRDIERGGAVICEGGNARRDTKGKKKEKEKTHARAHVHARV